MTSDVELRNNFLPMSFQNSSLGNTPNDSDNMPSKSPRESVLP
jgi:hypothetical protein